MRVTILVVAALCASTPSVEETRYELKVREAFAALQEQVEAVREETGVTNPDRLVPVLLARRSLWKHNEGGGFFERLNNDYWIHKMGGTGEAKLFNTARRTAEYVELHHVGGSTLVRLYDDRAEVKAEKSSMFRFNAKGVWER